MVLTLKRWKSRTPPGFEAGASAKARISLEPIHFVSPDQGRAVGAGWSSPVARQAHNLKVVGSNPTPATSQKPRFGGVFCVWGQRPCTKRPFGAKARPCHAGAMMRRLIRIALILIVLGLAATWAAGSYLAWPRTGPVLPPAPPARVIRLMASDGVHIVGSYWPGARPDGP